MIDYTQEDFTNGCQQYDVILDDVGNPSLWELGRALTHRGTPIPTATKGTGRWVGAYLCRVIHALMVSALVSQPLQPFADTEDRRDLIVLKGRTAGTRGARIRTRSAVVVAPTSYRVLAGGA